MSFGPFFVGELRTFTITVKDRVTKLPVDLTGITVDALFRKEGETANKWLDPQDNATPQAPLANGIVTYTMPAAWQAADKGAWSLQLKLTAGGGIIELTERLYFRVEDSLI